MSYKELKFSIVMPTYNREKTVGRAIRSVLDQSFQKWELVIVDDGSQDNTKDVIKEINDSRVKYYYQENRGRSAARNKGISLATGDFICFLDSDDIYYPHHLQVLYENICSIKEVALYHTRHCMNVNGEVREEKAKPIDPGNALTKVVIDGFPIHSVAVHSEILKQYDFNEDLVYYEDFDLWIRIALRFPIFKIECYTVEYIIHDSNTVGWSISNLEEKLKTLQHFKNRYEQYLPQGYLQKSLLNVLFGLASLYSKEERIKPLTYLAKIITVKPTSVFSRYFLSLLKNSLLKK